MSQPKQKSVEDLRAEIATLTKALANPTSTPDEKQIFSDTILKIQNQIGERTATRPPDPPPGQQPPIPIRVIRAGERTAAPAGQCKPATINQRIDKQGIDHSITTQVNATSATGAPLVSIDWGYGQIDTLTEGEARSRFTTCLRDLSESRLAGQGRLLDLPQYRSFSRAVAYYQALTLFWSAAPSALQLNISTKSPLKRAIFEMIVQAAQTIAD
jgi:hypothetical protein